MDATLTDPDSSQTRYRPEEYRRSELSPYLQEKRGDLSRWFVARTDGNLRTTFLRVRLTVAGRESFYSDALGRRIVSEMVDGLTT